MSVNTLSRYFLEEHPRESARALERHPVDELVSYLEDLPAEIIAGVIRYLLPDTAVECLAGMQAEHAAGVLDELGVDASARLLGRMHQDTQTRLLNELSADFAHRLRQLLRYPEGTVGRHMSPDVFIASTDMTVADVQAAAHRARSEIQGEIYVVSDNGSLAGVLDLRQLLLAAPTDEIQQIMNIPDTVLQARTNLEYVKDNPRWHFKDSLPVVEQRHHFAGILKRGVMNEVLGNEQYREQAEITVMETVIEVADLFWEACSDLIYPSPPQTPEEDRHHG